MRPAIPSVIGTVLCLISCGGSDPPVAVGTLERHRIELRAEQQEPILSIVVAEGDTVSAGDLVAELDPRRTRARQAAAEAASDLAAARLAEVVRGARPEEIDEAQARLDEARAALLQHAPELERARALVNDGVEPQSVLDAAEAAHSAAEARRDAARAKVELLLNGATVEELDQARADLAGKEAELVEQSVRLERLTIRAPRAGVVDALPFKIGDEPLAGGVIAVLLTGEAPHARVYIPVELRPSLAAGDLVSVRVEGLEGAFEGRVRLLSSEAAFTPFYALTERDRGRLVYLAEIDLIGETARTLPTGLPVEVSF